MALVGERRLGFGQWQVHPVINRRAIRSLSAGKAEPDRQSLLVKASADFARKFQERSAKSLRKSPLSLLQGQTLVAGGGSRWPHAALGDVVFRTVPCPRDVRQQVNALIELRAVCRRDRAVRSYRNSHITSYLDG